ncbi:NB-ARC domain-containing protein [Cryptosporangium phraense]
MRQRSPRRVFLSYTSELATSVAGGRSFVQAATDAINRAGDVPVAMQFFASSARPPAEECAEAVRTCELYVGLLGHRYGSLVPGTADQSYVKLEFTVAGESPALPRLMFLLSDGPGIEAPQSDFRATARQERLVSTFTTPDELQMRVYQALVELDRYTPAPYQVPAPATELVDRPALVDDLLTELLGGRAGTVAVTAVYGTGGFGKTTLAQMVCSRPEVTERFPGGILWVTLGEEVQGVQLADKVSNVVARLGGQRVYTDPEQAGLSLGELLDERPATLLVVDDVWSEQQLRPFLSGGRDCTRLVTTRLPGVLPRGVQPIRVDRMGRAEAEKLLTAGLPALDDATIDRLLDLTGGWPLLLSLVSGAIDQATEYVSDPQEFADELAGELLTDGPATALLDTEDGRGRAVRATVEASLAKLGDGERDRFLELAIFPEDVDIPLDVLTLLWGRTGRLSPREVQHLCWRLAGRSLVAGYRSDAGAKALRLHDVIRAYVRTVAGADRLRRVNRAFIESAAEFAGSDDQGATLWWNLPISSRYLWDHIVEHLADAANDDQAEELACDWQWIAAKLVLYGPAAVESDLARVDSPISVALGRAVGRTAYLLAPSDPPEAVVDTLRSRLGSEVQLSDYAAALSSEPSRSLLEARWPVPDLPDPALRRVLSGHAGRVNDCTFAPDGSWLATVGEDATIRVFDLPSGAERFVLSEHRATACAASPDGTWFVTGGRDRTLRVWDPASGTRRAAFALASPGTVLACTVGGHGRWIAAATHRGTIEIVSASDGASLAVLRGHSGPVTGCAISADSSVLVSVGNDGTIRTWDPIRGRELSVHRAHTSGIAACALAPDGRVGVSASSDGTLSLWTVGEDHRHEVTLTGHVGGVTACAIGPAGDWVASGGLDTRIRVWEAASGAVRSVLVGHTAGVTACVVSADGRRLASSSEDGTVRIWDPAAGVPDAHGAGRSVGVSGCAVSPDGTWIASAGQDHRVDVWDTERGAVRLSLSGHEARLTSCAVSPRGSWLLSTSEDGTARLWDPETGRAEAVATGHSGAVSDCAVSPDGTWFATAGADDWTVRLWDASGAKPRATLSGHDDAVTGCAISADGRQVVSVGADRTVRIWDAWAHELLRTWVGHDDVITGCAVDPKGRWIITTSRDGTVVRWDVATGKGSTLVHLADWATACDADRSGRWIVAVGHDRMVRVWDAQTGSCQAGIRVEGILDAVTWDPSRDRVCAGGDRGLYLLDFQRS